MLTALNDLPDGSSSWPDGAFAQGSGGRWQISTGDGENLTLEFTPQMLSAIFQPGAANTLLSVNVTLELVSYDAASLANGEVAFGLGAKNTDGQSTIGEVQFNDANLISLGKNQNGQFRAITQVPLQGQQIELAIRRTNATTLSFFIDGKSLGDSVFLFAQGEPITIILFVSGSQVVVEVSHFEIDFSPRDELP
jgi:hypothetical protein